MERGLRGEVNRKLENLPLKGGWGWGQNEAI
jgi:hypothetical protein